MSIHQKTLLKNPEIENDEENEPKPDNVDTRIKTLKKAGGNDSLNGPIDTAEKEELRYYPVAENSKAKKNSSMRKDTKTKNVGLRGQTVVIEKVGHSDRKERVVDSHTGNDDAESKDNDVGLRGHSDRKERVVDSHTGNNAAESKDNDDNNDVGLRGHSTRKERVLEGDTDNDTAESKDNDDHDNEQTDKNGRTREIEKVVHPARKERVVDDVTGNDDAESKGNNGDDDVVLRGHSARKERVVDGDTGNDDAESKDNDDNDDNANEQRDKNGRTRVIEKVGHSTRKERVVDGDAGNYDA